MKNGKDILQRYRELMKRKQDEKCVPNYNISAATAQKISNGNIGTSESHRKVYDFDNRDNRNQNQKVLAKNQVSCKNLPQSQPPQCQPLQSLRSTSHLQQLYRNSRIEADGKKSMLDTASIGTVQMSSSSQCSVASLADEILNDSFFDNKTVGIEQGDFVSWNGNDDESGDGILSFLIDDSINESALGLNISTCTLEAAKPAARRDLDQKLSVKFQNPTSQPRASRQKESTSSNSEMRDSNKFKLQQSKIMGENSSCTATKPLSRHRTHSPSESEDAAYLDVSRVVSDDGDETTVDSNFQVVESEECASSFVSQIFSKGNQQEPASPFTTMRCNNMDIALDESRQYARKIHEQTTALEKALLDITNLKAQRQRDEEKILELSSQARSKEEEMLQLLKKCSTYNSDEMAVEATHSNLSISQLKAELRKEERRNESLLKRNETLIKESKFADQTCVELSCRKQALEVEIDRMEQQLQNAKAENDDLHGVITRTAQYASKLESDHDAFVLKAAEQRTRLETRIEGLEKCLAESKANNDILTKRVDRLSKENAILNIQMKDLKEKNSSPEIRAEKQKENTTGIQINSLDGRRKQHLGPREILRERGDADCNLKDAREDRPEQLTTEKAHCSTPTKTFDMKHCSFSMHTPTSHVLAKTLQFELAKGHTIAERVVEGEKALAEAKVKIQSLLDELALGKEKNIFMEEKLAKSSTDYGIVKEAFVTSIESIFALEQELQQMLQTDKAANEACGTKIVLEMDDDLNKARTTARSIIEKISTLVKTLFAERTQFESDLICWKDLAEDLSQIQNCTEHNGPEESRQRSDCASEEVDLCRSHPGSCSSIASKPSIPKTTKISGNDVPAVLEAQLDLKRKLDQSQSDLQRSKSELYLFQQEYYLLSKKYENSQQISEQKWKENEKLHQEKNRQDNEKMMLENEINECHKRIRDLEDFISILNDELAVVKENAMKCSESRNNLGEQLRSLISASEENMQSLTSKLECAQISITDAASMISFFMKCIEQANRFSQETTEAGESMIKETDSVKLPEDSADNNIIALRNELGKMLKLRDLAFEESKASEQKLRDLETSLSCQVEEYHALRDELRSQRAKFQQRWNSMVERRTLEENQMQETILLIKAELLATKDEYDGTITTLQNRLDGAEQELNALRIELIDSNRKKEEALLKLSDIEHVESTRLLAMNSDIETKEKELEALRRDIQSLSHRNLQLKDAVLRLTQKCEYWSDNYQKLTLESDCIKGVLSETTRQKLELEQLQEGGRR